MRGGSALERTLKELKPGEKGVIKKVSGEGAVKRRLMDMGVTKGAEILVRKVAPLGDPIEVNIRGYELTFRKNEAENIMIE
ncbi:MAG TPA: FeoA family protein [Clostridia bacterium]